MLFRGCAVDGTLDEARVRAAVQLVIAQKPRGYAAILSHFHRLVKLAVARRTARVESAIPLPPELQSGLRANLTRLHGAGLQFQFADEPSLIGGLRIQVGSTVYDGSIRTRLRDLADTI